MRIHKTIGHISNVPFISKHIFFTYFLNFHFYEPNFFKTITKAENLVLDFSVFFAQ
jgi:hypothetical protein